MEIIWVTIVACVFLGNNVNSQAVQIPEKGFSDQYKSENTLGQYAFGYNEDHTSGGSFRRETGDRYGNKIGSYGLRVADGRVRIVNYVADRNGYRADVVSNEPGVHTQRHNGFFGIDKTRIYGVAIPGFRYSGEAPFLTFSRGHQQVPMVPVDTGRLELSTNWNHQDLAVEDGPMYAQAYAVSSDDLRDGNKMAQKSIDFETSASRERLSSVQDHQDLVVEDEPLYAVSSDVVQGGGNKMGQTSINDFETSASEERLGEVVESNFVDGSSEHVGESGIVETAVESSTSNNATDVTTTAVPTKD